MRSRRGFTLIELLIVMAILLLLAYSVNSMKSPCRHTPGK